MSLKLLFRVILIATISVQVASCSKNKKESKQSQPAPDLGSQFKKLIGNINQEPETNWSDKQLAIYEKNLNQLQLVLDELIALQAGGKDTAFKLPKNTQAVIDQRKEILAQIKAKKKTPPEPPTETSDQ